MPEIIECRSFDELQRRIAKDLGTMEKKVRGAAKKAAKRGVPHIKQNVPVAHGEIRESVHAEGHARGAAVIVDAPHAAAVNDGSRPHYPPLAPLIEWVKLRGMQGLGTDRQISRLPGKTTASAARSVAAELRSFEANGATSVNAPESIARAIQQAIGKHGTRPHHFIEESLSTLHGILDEEIERAIRGNLPESGSVSEEAIDAPGRSFHEGSRGGVFFQGKHGKVWVNKQAASKLRSEGRVQPFKKS